MHGLCLYVPCVMIMKIGHKLEQHQHVNNNNRTGKEEEAYPRSDAPRESTDSVLEWNHFGFRFTGKLKLALVWISRRLHHPDALNNYSSARLFMERVRLFQTRLSDFI